MAGVCVAGACMAGGMYGRGHVWQGVCMAGGHAWQGCVWQGGMHGRGCVCVAGGHAWQGVCMVGGCVRGRGHAWLGGGACVARTPPAHSYWNAFLLTIDLMIIQKYP